MTVRELIYALVRETKGVAWDMPVRIGQDDNSEKEVGGVGTEDRDGAPTVVVNVRN